MPGVAYKSVAYEKASNLHSVVNKAKKTNLKTLVTKTQSTPNFPKKTIFKIFSKIFSLKPYPVPYNFFTILNEKYFSKALRAFSLIHLPLVNIIHFNGLRSDKSFPFNFNF